MSRDKWFPAAALKRGDVIKWDKTKWHQSGIWVVSEVTTHRNVVSVLVHEYEGQRGAPFKVGNHMACVAEFDARWPIWILRRNVQIKL